MIFIGLDFSSSVCLVIGLNTACIRSIIDGKISRLGDTHSRLETALFSVVLRKKSLVGLNEAKFPEAQCL